MERFSEFLSCALCLNWISKDFFFRGWIFFFKQEWCLIGALGLTIGIVEFVAGCHYYSLITHWIILILYRRLMAGGICTSEKCLDGQTIVITGCNVGIGKETARELSHRGARIIMACRNLATAEKTAEEIRKETGKELQVMQLDLASLTSVRAFAKELRAKRERIHMLINNAGVIAGPRQMTEDGFEMHLATNHLGHFLLTNLLLPLLSHSEPARIINVSALLHAVGTIRFDDKNFEEGYSSIIAYSNSKLANILFTRQLAMRLKDSNIQVFSLHPGVVQSDIGRNMPGIRRMMSFLIRCFCKKTIEGAQTTVYCALEANQDDGHYYYSDCAVGFTSKLARDDEAAKKLWDISEEMVALSK